MFSTQNTIEKKKRSRKRKVSNTNQQSEEITHTFKVIVVGESGVGKTSYIKQFAKQMFSPYYKTTIGVDCVSRVVNHDDDSIIRLQLFDIAGQERFHGLTRVFYRDAMAAIIVYDVTRPDTLDNVRFWKCDIDEKVYLPHTNISIPCVLIGNKCDLTSNIPDSTIDQITKELSFVSHIQVSAKENKNVDESIHEVIGHCLKGYNEVFEVIDTMSTCSTATTTTTTDYTSEYDDFVFVDHVDIMDADSSPSKYNNKRKIRCCT
jgi:small GTP-binding protein